MSEEKEYNEVWVEFCELLDNIADARKLRFKLATPNYGQLAKVKVLKASNKKLRAELTQIQKEINKFRSAYGIDESE